MLQHSRSHPTATVASVINVLLFSSHCTRTNVLHRAGLLIYKGEGLGHAYRGKTRKIKRSSYHRNQQKNKRWKTNTKSCPVDTMWKCRHIPYISVTWKVHWLGLSLTVINEFHCYFSWGCFGPVLKQNKQTPLYVERETQTSAFPKRKRKRNVQKIKNKK